jgi:hypothetical protein
MPLAQVTLAGLLVAVLWTGCAAPSDGDGAAGTGALAGSSGAGGSAGTGGRIVPLGRERCQAPAGVSSSPGTIEEAVQLLNALPKPTSVACFIESLARPLSLYATDSIFSAQPAHSIQSPRVFLKIDQLWLSMVVDGDASFLLEFGFLPDPTVFRSIKAELKLPLTEAVTPAAAYERVRYLSGTSCGICHYDERREEGIDFAEAFSSISFQPRSETRVSVESLQRENLACDFQTTFPRCELLSALFDGGPVSETPFPADMLTFF